MKRSILLALVLIVSTVFGATAEAGARHYSRTSSRTQAGSGSYGHFVGVPMNHYEGVAMASTRRDAIRNACYANDTSKKAVSKSVSRGANGMFYSSVIYKNR